jgi:outer membrane protein TolC
MDAMHEASRELVKQWFELLRTQAQVQNALHTLSLSKQHQRLAQQRLKQGEISQLDAQLALADLQHAQANWQTAQADWQSAQLSFRKHYPDLALPSESLVKDLPQHDLPTVLEDTSAMVNDFVNANHELLLLRTDAQRLTLTAQRQDRNRYPDPTIGIFTSSEFGADERITGVNLSIPIPSASRSHLAQAAHAQALAAQDLVMSQERRLSAYFESLIIQYNNKRLAAQDLRAASAAQNEAARKSQTAYSLGEMSMSESLQVARFAHEQQLSADLMHLQVLELLAMIELDLHQIYDFDD